MSQVLRTSCDTLGGGGVGLGVGLVGVVLVGVVLVGVVLVGVVLVGVVLVSVVPVVVLVGVVPVGTDGLAGAGAGALLRSYAAFLVLPALVSSKASGATTEAVGRSAAFKL